MHSSAARWFAGAAFLFALAGCNNGPASPTTSTPPSSGGSGGSGGAAAAKHRGTIGVSLLTMANPFFKEMGDAMKAEGEKNGYEVIIQAADMDASRQKDQVNDFLVKKVSAIVLCPVDSRSIGTSIQEANKAGVPVFTADIACLDKAAKVVSHIATDNYEGGKVAGQAMIDALGGKGKVAIIDHPEVESVLLRTKGFKEVIAGAKGIEIVAQVPGGALRDSAYKATQDVLEKHPQLDGIFAINDPTAFGVVAALEKAGRAGNVKVIGFDGQPEAKQAIKEGKIYGDAIQYPDKIGQLTIQAIAKYMAGEKVEPQTLIPTGLYKQADAAKDPALK
jgi:ribose transport system substrate-binding protein